MKRHNLKFLPVVFLSFALIAGCAGKNIVSEDIGEKASAEKQSAETRQAELVPESLPASPAGGDVSVQELNAAQAPPKTGGQYASLAPGDDLTEKAVEAGKLYTVYFDFDRYNIRDDDRELLSKNASWLKLNSKVNVLIEGHADERGETEYNLALGEKRSKSVEKYLEDMGISGKRLKTISYGEERPADSGHNDLAWSKNRRAEFKIVE